MQGWGFWQDQVSASPTPLNMAFLFRVQGAIQLVLSPFSAGIITYVTVDTVCLWEEVSSGSSYTAILNHSYKFFKKALNLQFLYCDSPQNVTFPKPIQFIIT